MGYGRVHRLFVGSDGASYWEPKNNTRAWNFTPKKYLASKFSTQKKIKDWNTSILNYSFKQTLRLKKICDRSLTPPPPSSPLRPSGRLGCIISLKSWIKMNYFSAMSKAKLKLTSLSTKPKFANYTRKCFVLFTHHVHTPQSYFILISNDNFPLTLITSPVTFSKN